MDIRIIAVGRLKDKFFTDAFAEYQKRLSPFCKLGVEEIPQEKLPELPSDKETEKALDAEGEKILQKIPPGSFTVPLCIEGKQLTSEQFAKLISDKTNEGVGSLTFIIGGSCGLSEKVKKAGDFKLSMSVMTFPHRLARIMLAEQLYRAFMINSNRKYHK